MNFEKYITHKAINSNSVAKYSDSDNEMIKLVHVYDQDNLSELTMTVKEYDDMFDSIPEGNDTLAWILDNKFNCNMLKSDEDIDIWAWEPYALYYPQVFELDFS